MILIGLGANLPSWAGGPRQTLEAALATLAAAGVALTRRSRWYRTAPVPVSDQPWFVNAVAAVETDLAPAALLSLMHRVEAQYGRQRSVQDSARTLDLDLLAYGDLVQEDPGCPILPHPRLHQRAFVLLPLAEAAPGWVHPGSGLSVGELIARLPPDQQAEPLSDC